MKKKTASLDFVADSGEFVDGNGYVGEIVETYYADDCDYRVVDCGNGTYAAAYTDWSEGIYDSYSSVLSDGLSQQEARDYIEGWVSGGTLARRAMRRCAFIMDAEDWDIESDRMFYEGYDFNVEATRNYGDVWDIIVWYRLVDGEYVKRVVGSADSKSVVMQEAEIIVDSLFADGWVKGGSRQALRKKADAEFNQLVIDIEGRLNGWIDGGYDDVDIDDEIFDIAGDDAEDVIDELRADGRIDGDGHYVYARRDARTKKADGEHAYSADDSVKFWYMDSYPTDELGKDISSDITFGDCARRLCGGIGDAFYDYVGAHDSLVRERIFQELAHLYGVGYDCVYEMWLIGEDLDLMGKDEFVEHFPNASEFCVKVHE